MVPLVDWHAAHTRALYNAEQRVGCNAPKRWFRNLTKLTDLEMSYMGIYAEIAFCQWHGLFWSDDVGRVDGGVDASHLGLKIDVKCRQPGLHVDMMFVQADKGPPRADVYVHSVYKPDDGKVDFIKWCRRDVVLEYGPPRVWPQDVPNYVVPVHGPQNRMTRIADLDLDVEAVRRQ